MNTSHTGTNLAADNQYTVRDWGIQDTIAVSDNAANEIAAMKLLCGCTWGVGAMRTT